MRSLLESSGELWRALAVFALAIPLEHFFSTGKASPLSERFGNVAAMFVHFIAGTMLLDTMLEQPRLASLMNFPDEPRLSVLQNPSLYGLAAVFIVDGLYYVYHRLQHSSRLLWRIHALHHTDPAVNVTTARRTHFLEKPLQFFLLVTPAFWILGWNEEGAAMMGLLGSSLLYFAHMDVRFPLGPVTSVVVGPQYHRIHHVRAASEQGFNFAQAFPIFDLIGGTYRRPRSDEYVVTGVQGCDTARARWRPILW